MMVCMCTDFLVYIVFFGPYYTQRRRDAENRHDCYVFAIDLVDNSTTSSENYAK